jgi:nucleoid DNA-binding protein
MNKPSLTKKEIAATLADNWCCSEEEASSKFEQVLEVLADGLVRGERVYLDDFGSLTPRVKPAQFGKFVPGQGEIDIPEHTVVDFEMFEPLKDRLAGLGDDSGQFLSGDEEPELEGIL